EPAFLPMILWRLGPKRLSPSLVVWQVRHALLNVSCPDSVSAPLRSDSWGTAENPRNIRNVVQTNPEIAERDIRLPGDSHNDLNRSAGATCAFALKPAVIFPCS